MLEGKTRRVDCSLKVIKRKAGLEARRGKKKICIFTFGILTHAKGERVWRKNKLSTHVKEEEVEEG